MTYIWTPSEQLQTYKQYIEKFMDEDIPSEQLISYAKETLDDLKAADYEDVETIKIVTSVYFMYVSSKTKDTKNMVVEVLIDKGFPVTVIDILKLYKFRYDSFTPDPKQLIPKNLLSAIHNFTDASIKFAKALFDEGIVSIMLDNLKYKPYLDKEDDEYVQSTLTASLSVLHNVAKVPDVKQQYRDLNAKQIIMPFTTSSNVECKMLSMMILTIIMTDKENKDLEDNSGAIPFMVEFLAKALKDTDRRRHEGFTPIELAESLSSLADNDSNKTTIVKAGALPLFVSMLKYDDINEQICAATALWNLSFDKTSRDRIKKEPGCIEALQNLQKSDDKTARDKADGALFEIMEKYAGRIAQNSEQQGHVFLSYSSNNQEDCLRIKDRLESDGYSVWIDVDNMTGDIYAAMASAVENAAVVLICVCEKYKQSEFCRLEAEYTRTCKKEFIPIIMEKDYKADGWLGILIAGQLYIEYEKLGFNDFYKKLAKEIGPRGKEKKNPPTADPVFVNEKRIEVVQNDVQIAQNSEQQYHIFLSYSSNNKEDCLRIKDRLESDGYRVWMDVDNMTGHIMDYQEKAWENAAVVLIFVCEKYKQSTNCRIEAQYAHNSDKDCIPIIMEKNYEPDGWLGMLTGDKLSINFEMYSFNIFYEKLVKEIGTRGKATESM